MIYFRNKEIEKQYFLNLFAHLQLFLWGLGYRPIENESISEEKEVDVNETVAEGDNNKKNF